LGIGVANVGGFSRFAFIDNNAVDLTVTDRRLHDVHQYRRLALELLGLGLELLGSVEVPEQTRLLARARANLPLSVTGADLPRARITRERPVENTRVSPLPYFWAPSGPLKLGVSCQKRVPNLHSGSGL
jgi:hypothetical protein